MAKKKSKAREKQRQQQKARKAAKKKRLQQSGRTSGYSSIPGTQLIGKVDDFSLTADHLSMLLIDSEYLADEPEFEDIFIDPLACLEAWNDAADKVKFDPDRFDRLSEEEQEDIRLDLLEATVKGVLTAELRQTILKQVDTLQQRYKNKNMGEGISLDFLQASGIHTFLKSDKKGKSWAVVGLVRALVQESLHLGFELSDIIGGDPEQLLADAEKEKQLQVLYKKAPKLRRYIEEKMSGFWQESMTDVYTGEWEINLFTPDELEGSAKMFRRHFPIEELGEEEPDDARERSEKFVEEMDEYIRRLLTPERTKAMSQYLSDLQANTPQGPRLLFLNLLHQDLEETDEPGDLAPTLMKILMGETVAILKQQETDSKKSK
jgi:hypothetical protein